MVEGTGLENRHTGEPGIESSNLSLSVCPVTGVALRSRFFSGHRAMAVAGVFAGTGGRVV